jgi:hypothetical protein
MNAGPSLLDALGAAVVFPPSDVFDRSDQIMFCPGPILGPRERAPGFDMNS